MGSQNNGACDSAASLVCFLPAVYLWKTVDSWAQVGDRHYNG